MAETDIDIYGGHSQVNPAATQAIQNNYYIRLVPERETTACTVVVPDAEVDTAAGSPTTYGLYVQHDSVDVPSLLRKAERHIVLHAAYYPKYGLDSQGMVLMEALRGNPRLRLRVIFTRTDKNPWLKEFARILRPHYTGKDFIKALELSKDFFLNIKALELSKDFFLKLKEQALPGQVEISDTGRLPLFPVILVDDTVIVGHYAHSSTIAPHGLWLTIHNPKISGMYEALTERRLDVSRLTDEEKAILRYVEECVPKAF